MQLLQQSKRQAGRPTRHKHCQLCPQDGFYQRQIYYLGFRKFHHNFAEAPKYVMLRDHGEYLTEIHACYYDESPTEGAHDYSVKKSRITCENISLSVFL